MIFFSTFNLQKKIKISAAKRSHHINHKKNFKLKKQPIKPKKSSSKKDNIVTNKSTVFPQSKSKKSIKSKGKIATQAVPNVEPDVEVEAEDVMDMLDNDEMDHLQNINVQGIDIIMGDKAKRRIRKRKANISDDDENEDDVKAYAKYSEEHQNEKIQKLLLPIKTKDGKIIIRKMAVNKFSTIKDDDNKQKEVDVKKDDEDDEGIDTEDSDDLDDGDEEKEKVIEKLPNSISTADLLIKREQELQKQKYRIGIICSGILEKPEDKMKNFGSLMEFMDERAKDGTLHLTSIRKIATISVLELFKDIIPEYRIGFIDLKETKVKKHTFERVNFENALLSYYKIYLQKLEIFANAVSQKKRGFHQPLTPDTILLAELGVKCMCDLLLAHPYFNFSQNIAQMLVFLSNNKYVSIRKMVSDTFIEIYKTDKRLDLALYIIRRTNFLIKTKSNNVYADVLHPLIWLPIKNVNLDAEKEKELKKKKLEAQKSRVMNLSKKEKKRIKKLKEVDKELLEAQAEENKQTKQTKLTEIAKMMFTIYFRILKNDPNSRLLSSTLEGIAK